MAIQKTLTLIDAATIIATSASTAQSIAPMYKRWVGVVTVGTITGTSPTLDITLQHSSDGTNWVTLRAFTQLVSGSASTTTHLFAAAATDYLVPLLPYVRASYTIGGSNSPTFNTVTVKLMLDE
jgi:alpha-D-ribose 1-methylphosphonate 5-phosphate C-P lyase